jgi:hypothetical protein
MKRHCSGPEGPHCKRQGYRRRAGLQACLIALALFGAAPLVAQTATQSPTRPHVAALAGERQEGRLTGSNGERLAAEYLVEQLKKMGARPLPNQKDYRLPFEFTAGARDGGSKLSISIKGGATASSGGTARALSFSDNGSVTGEVVFAGYGIVVPDSPDFGYDSYATLDVKDKIVVVLRYFPEDADAKTKGILARYSGERFKAMAARQHGAKALLIVTGPRSPNAGELIPMAFDTALAGSGIVAASISGETASAMLRPTGKTLEEVQRSFDSGNPHAAGFAIPDLTVSVSTTVLREKRTGYNIAGYLPSSGGQPSAKPWIAIGAHYDHLGHGENGSSLAGSDERGRVHYGADDNASGSAAVLAVGERFASQTRRRNVLLAFWSGEELGLIGSGAFVNQPPIAVDQIAAYFNFDMVGRMQDNKLTVQAAGSSPVWARVIEQANVAAGFDLVLQPDPFQPTDVASFNGAGVPCLNFFTGTHPDYHKPSDTADKIQYDDLDRIVAFAVQVARRVGETDEPPAFTKVDQPAPGGGRAGVRVFTGTVPDYSTEVKGLLLGGVIGGGPAEQAGLQKGDVVVEIAGHTIANIYDYTFALELLKIGEPAKVVYMRDGQKRETMLTPAARK